MATKSIRLRPESGLATPTTLVDSVVEAIMSAASEGILKPGERVVEAELSRQLDVSRVPVREALRLLESQGIVENTPYSGMRLMQVDDEQIRNTIKVRHVLEQLAAEEYLEACKHGEIDLSALEGCIERMRVAADDGDYYGLALADTEFHRTLCGLTGNMVLLDTWQPLSRKMTIIFGIAAVQKDLQGIIADHVALLDAFRLKNRRLILTKLKKHTFAYLDLIGTPGMAGSEPAADGARARRPRRSARRAIEVNHAARSAK